MRILAGPMDNEATGEILPGPRPRIKGDANVTKLQKAVRRTADVGRETLVITLYPGAVLGMRRSRTRREYTISLQTCYTLAILQEQDRIKAERKKARGLKFRANRGLLKAGSR